MAELLLEHKAQVDPVDYYGETPLSIASGNNHVGIVKLLLSNKANVHSVDHNVYRTPLHWAAWNGAAKVVDCLVACGSDLCRMDRDACTPAALALIKQHKTVLNHLMKPRMCQGLWISHKMVFEQFDETLQKQCVVLAQLWSACSGDLLSAIHSLPSEMFHAMLCELWFAYFV